MGITDTRFPDPKPSAYPPNFPSTKYCPSEDVHFLRGIEIMSLMLKRDGFEGMSRFESAR